MPLNSNGNSISGNGAKAPCTQDSSFEIVTRGSEVMPGVILAIQSDLVETGEHSLGFGIEIT